MLNNIYMYLDGAMVGIAVYSLIIIIALMRMANSAYSESKKSANKNTTEGRTSVYKYYTIRIVEYKLAMVTVGVMGILVLAAIIIDTLF